MDLIFDGRVGEIPESGSVEYTVLSACGDKRVWGEMHKLESGDFERAIDALRNMGWGFVWVTLQ